MVANLFPDNDEVTLEQISLMGEEVTFPLRSARAGSCCPGCRQRSSHVHSRYSRRLQDLPWQVLPVPLQLKVWRFFCDNEACSRRIFCERLEQTASAHSRTTNRLTEIHTAIGYVLGGEPGSRLTQKMAIPTSADTLLRRVRDNVGEDCPHVRILGVDDFAFRKGQSYGTILCDLESGNVIDLLPDRTAETLTQWLEQHPEVEIVSRDRAGAYASAAEQGAPQAQQIADRFHLLQNVQQALQRMLDRQRKNVLEALTEEETTSEDSEVVSLQPLPEQAGTEPETSESEPEAASAPTLAELRCRKLYEQVHPLHQEKISIREISRRLDLTRSTVRRYLSCESFPVRARRSISRVLDRYSDYLRQRLQEGYHNAARLYEKLQEKGYTGSIASAPRHVHRLREELGIPKKPASEHRPDKPKVSSATLGWLLVRDPEDLNEDKRKLTERLRQQIPTLDAGVKIAIDFRQIIRGQESEKLEDWLQKAKDSEIPEWTGFANGIEQDQKAVQAALDLEWSNGPVEGAVNRLKLIKRQMFGRASFDLLKARVIHRN